MFSSAKLINETVKIRLVDNGSRPVTVKNRTGWCADFVNLPEATVVEVFGESGQSLYRLISQMDVDHPDLEFSIQEKLFNGETPTMFASIVGLSALAVKHQKESLLGPLNCLKFLPDGAKEINTKSFIRFLADPARREEQRRLKKPQVIDMSTVSRKGEEIWNSQPDSFESLIRYEDAYKSEIAAAKLRANRFASLGCVALHAEVMKTVDAFESQVVDSYMGFNRLTFNAASVILAKWHGYNLVPPFVLADFPTERSYKVVVDPKYFKDLGFDFFCRPDESDIPWPYSPRVYPISEMEPLPLDVKEIIDLCENYSGFNGKPLFDHYAVMVPGIDYPPLREGHYSLRTNGGVLVTYENQNEARFALDKLMLSCGVFSAVVMGERDGKCYCLSVWS
jgi:hypothetical protein